jgi:hypothetical protein
VEVTDTEDEIREFARVEPAVAPRKLFVRAAMTDADGNVLSEANGLMIKLLPHQP